LPEYFWRFCEEKLIAEVFWLCHLDIFYMDPKPIFLGWVGGDTI